MKTVSPPVIYYHSVAPKPFTNWVLRWLTFELHYFEDQLQYLRARGYRTVFFDEWHRIRTGGQESTGREICISFDDGLLDNWVYVYPLIRKMGMRFTLFISPECIDPRDVVRPTLEDVWAGKCKEEELEGLGYLTWNEIRRMQESGCVDIQSHTMTHAKYIHSPQLRSFYYGGFTGLHPILNARPELRADYMLQEGFEDLLPQGAPLFEEISAVSARKHQIHPEFFSEVAAEAGRFNLCDERERAAYETRVRQIHADWQRSGELVAGVETEADYQSRIRYEIVDSKRIIEEKLGKPVQFLCWPHGDNTAETHALAREAGYLATTAGKMTGEAGQADRIPRIGTMWRLGHWMNRRKLHYKLASHYKKQPYYAIWLLNEYKNRLRQGN